MNSMELLLTLAVAVYIVWELVGIFSSRGKIKVKAAVFGRWLSMVLVAVLIGVAVFRNRDNLQYYWIVFAGMGVSFILYAFMKSGLGEKGLYLTGHYVAYTSLKSYYVDRENEKTVGIRFEAKRKDYVLEFPKEQQELVVAYMVREKVPPSDIKKSNRRQPG